jgi:hypothetical protein
MGSSLPDRLGSAPGYPQRGPGRVPPQHAPIGRRPCAPTRREPGLVSRDEHALDLAGDDRHARAPGQCRPPDSLPPYGFDRRWRPMRSRRYDAMPASLAAPASQKPEPTDAGDPP